MLRVATAAAAISGAAGQGENDPFAPIFHISPAFCHGGWTNDPNGPMEYRNVSHMFYQYHPIPCQAGPGPGHCKISWGHVAGNLSHWKCMPLAIVSGVDGDNHTLTGYDTEGIFTGSITVVDGKPIATYPGEPGDKMCEAFPMDLDDPLLTRWAKYPGNPIKPDGPRTTGPLGCTSSLTCRRLKSYADG